jgi:hypothetical protein
MSDKETDGPDTTVTSRALQAQRGSLLSSRSWLSL